jgi:methylglutaconyl-CoA hydratase
MGAVLVSRDGPVATVTMNRPEAHNTFNEELIAGLRDAFDSLSGDRSVRVVILAGEGRSFSAGADLEWMKRASDWSEDDNKRDAEELAAMLRRVAECAHPVVARVHGNAFGGGAGLTAAADVAVAAESVTFGFTEVRLGLLPATISPHVIEKIGPGRALPLFLTGERFDAQRAHEIGLVHRVVPADELDGAVREVVSMLLQGAPEAQRTAKRMVRRVAQLDRRSVDQYTAELIAGLRKAPEGREGVAAFLEKRKPAWVVEA